VKDPNEAEIASTDFQLLIIIVAFAELHLLYSLEVRDIQQFQSAYNLLTSFQVSFAKDRAKKTNFNKYVALNLLYLLSCSK